MSLFGVTYSKLDTLLLKSSYTLHLPLHDFKILVEYKESFQKLNEFIY